MHVSYQLSVISPCFPLSAPLVIINKFLLVTSAKCFVIWKPLSNYFFEKHIATRNENLYVYIRDERVDVHAQKSFDRVYLANGLSKLHRAPQTINIWSASGARVRGRFSWKILKSFNLSMALSTWMRTLAIWGVDFVASLESCLPKK